MEKQYRQEFSIKSIQQDDTQLLQNTLNAMASAGWELYSIYEAEQNGKIVYNCIFVKEVENIKDENDDELINFRSSVEKMLYSKDEPYELCLNMQKKIKDKKKKIERVKKFLENSKDAEREILNDEVRKEIDELNDLKRDLKEILAPSKMSGFLGEEKLSISLSTENYSLCDPKLDNNLLAQTVKVRQELTKELGYIIPKVQFIENTSLEEFDFSINVHGVAVANSKAYPEYLAFFEDELNIKKLPKGSIKIKDPLTKREIAWIKKDLCKDFWVEGIEASEYIANYLSYYAIFHVDEIFDYNDLNRYIDFVNNENSMLVDTVMNDYMSPSELKYLLIQLIRERVSVKDIVFIFEKLSDFSNDPSKADLLDKLRLMLSRQISSSIANDNKEIFAYEVDDTTIDLLERQVDLEEGSIKIDLSKFSKFKKILKQMRTDIVNQNAVLVAPQQFRLIIFILVSQLFIDIPVVCYEEIAPEYNLKILGKV